MGNPAEEPVEEIAARVSEAAKYVDLERLALSTQCGFASVSIGANLIGEDTQQRKLELVGEVARHIWKPEDGLTCEFVIGSRS